MIEFPRNRLRRIFPAAVLCLAAAGASMQAAAADMKALMLEGHEKMMAVQMTGKPDIDFAIAMREHHRGALDMAQWELDNGKDPKMKKMAQEIIVAQKKEIAEFDDYLARAGHVAAPGPASGGRGQAHPQ